MLAAFVSCLTLTSLSLFREYVISAVLRNDRKKKPVTGSIISRVGLQPSRVRTELRSGLTTLRI